ncbi:hypothetical protein ACTFIU_008766 [Dictyostelium citrinum]
MNKTLSNKKPSSKTNNSDNNNNSNNTINDLILSLPTYSLEVYEEDYFNELILEPLSFLKSGDVVITTSPTKKRTPSISPSPSPIKKGKDNNDNDSSDSDEDNDLNFNGNEEDNGEGDQINSNYYCPFCKKKFQTEQTWNTHINSSKHLKSIKDQKKKSTTTGTSNNTPTKNNNNSLSSNVKSSPSSNTTKTKSSSSSSPSSSTNSKDNEFLQEQILQTQQAIKIKNSKPNLACKNLFTIARSYCQKQYIRDSAKTLNLILDILTINTTTTSNNTNTPLITSTSTSLSTTSNKSIVVVVEHSLNNILNNATLLCKTHLYFGRLTRLFNQRLSEYHFLQCFNYLGLLNNDQLQKYESSLISSSPSNLYKTFMNQLDKFKTNLKQQVNDDTNTDKEKEKEIESIIQINKYINEIAGGLCYCEVNFKSIILYILASCITFKYKLYKESLESNTRAFKLLSSLKQYHWSIDLLLNNLLIKLKLNNTISSSTTTTIIINENKELLKEKEEKEYQNIIIILIKYCILIDDKIRLSEILGDSNFKEIISIYFKNNDYINCLIESSNQFLIENYKKIDQLKDDYEHLIYSNKDFIFIFNQFDLKKKILLQK